MLVLESKKLQLENEREDDDDPLYNPHLPLCLIGVDLPPSLDDDPLYNPHLPLCLIGVDLPPSLSYHQLLLLVVPSSSQGTTLQLQTSGQKILRMLVFIICNFLFVS
ncbi:hypothetical protein QE152_g4643 [Popillia japonica]|uniref:Uncharacterized protein n=1 Tax=Popillia japonica TaxID=7064 RepID=A0AAW1MT70_POPJA